MARVNEYYADLQNNFLFAEVSRRVAAHQAEHPQLEHLRLGIGDVTSPLVPAVTAALHRAVDEMGQAEAFKGYGPEQGYSFLREAIVQHDFASRGVSIDSEAIFISDGSKCDVGNLQELFSPDAVIAVTDPVYPVYVDSNIMAGRGGSRGHILYLPCTQENGFVPELPNVKPNVKVDVIYLCYPNNPTGTVLTRSQLAAWVEYALACEAVIVFDAAYEAYISDPDIPHSIYEIDGAEKVAIECRSFSKTAGFTGLRCAYTVIPKTVRAKNVQGEAVSLQSMWLRRQCTRYNGCPYIVQRAAEAVYSPEAQGQLAAVLQGYMRNARAIRETVQEMGLYCVGGVNAPYVWMRTPHALSSWECFDVLLGAGIVCTPGVGFGPSGEGYVRFTAFGSAAHTRQAMERLKTLKNFA